MTTAPLVRRATEDGIATLTLDSPHNRNALSSRLITELTEALAEAAQDSEVRAVVLTHTGNTFCAGADLGEARDPSGDAVAVPRKFLQLLRTVTELPRPVVARVTGHARAGGLGLLGACDIVAAGADASFAFTEVQIGLAPAVLSTTVLPRLDPRAAARYFLTGERFGAVEAARIGLATLAAEDDLDKALAPVLNGLRTAAPKALAATKPLTNGDVLHSLDRDAEPMTALAARLLASDEAREGMASFLERRRPAWATRTNTIGSPT